jgi:hypothetical protein
MTLNKLDVRPARFYNHVLTVILQVVSNGLSPVGVIVNTVLPTHVIDPFTEVTAIPIKYPKLTAAIRSIFFSFWHNSPQWVRTSSFTRFLDHTQRRTTVGRAPLDEWSARRGDLYLTTHNTHNRQTSMPPRWDSKPQSQQASVRRPTP